jgi:hypothetical protein
MAVNVQIAKFKLRQYEQRAISGNLMFTTDSFPPYSIMYNMQNLTLHASPGSKRGNSLNTPLMKTVILFYHVRTSKAFGITVLSRK